MTPEQPEQEQPEYLHGLTKLTFNEVLDVLQRVAYATNQEEELAHVCVYEKRRCVSIEFAEDLSPWVELTDTSHTYYANALDGTLACIKKTEDDDTHLTLLKDVNINTLLKK